jgi:hypothetical protein
VRPPRPAEAGEFLYRLLGGEPADAEVCYSQAGLPIGPLLHQDVRRLEVAVDDGRI